MYLAGLTEGDDTPGAVTSRHLMLASVCKVSLIRPYFPDKESGVQNDPAACPRALGQYSRNRCPALFSESVALRTVTPRLLVGTGPLHDCHPRCERQGRMMASLENVPAR